MGGCLSFLKGTFSAEKDRSATADASSAAPADFKIAPIPIVRLMSGYEVPGVFADLSLARGDQIRDRVAGALGWPTSCVRLLVAATGSVLFDSDSLPADGDGEVFVLVDEEALQKAIQDLDDGILTSKHKLCLASQFGNVEAVKLLLLQGEDPNEPDEARINQTALHVSASRNDVVITKLLLSAGADVHLTDEDGFTALHRACDKCCTSVFRPLLGAGSDRHKVAVSRRSHASKGESPTEMVLRTSNVDIIQQFADGVILAQEPTFIMPS